jgi:hypothetical protein
MTPLEWSEEGRKEIFAAYVKAQMAMGEVKKDQKNTHFNTQYATLSSAIAATIPAFNAAGLAVVQSPSFDGEVLTVETYVIHDAGGWMKSVLQVRPMKPDAQGLGSAITYLRRYGLMAISGVAPEDDDGNAASAEGAGGKPFKEEPPRMSLAVTAAQTAITMAETREELKAWKDKNADVIKAMPRREYEAVVKHLNERWEALAPQPSQSDADSAEEPPPAPAKALNGHAKPNAAFDISSDEIPF